MLDKFGKFWNRFWIDFIKKQYNKIFKEITKDNVQEFEEIGKMNLLAIVSNTLNNLTNVESSFDVQSESTLDSVERLKLLSKNIEKERYNIFSEMASKGDFYIFPATNRKGEIYHTFLTQEQVRIISMDGEDITEAYGIIDWVQDSKTSRIYYLLRHHVLEENGDLIVSYSIFNDLNEQTTYPEWEYLEDETIKFVNANHIGFGRYKSPISSRGLSPIYGVPLNFGCSEIEQRIFNDLKLIEDEFKNGKSKIFADPLILRKNEHKKTWDIPENIFPINHREGSTASIDIFNPNLRFSEHYSKLQTDFALYEKQIGTSRGILTEMEHSTATTATEVRRANADTIALIGKFRAAIDEGNLMTLEADAVFLNIPRDIWNYTSDWYDPFENPSEQWTRLLEARNAGAVTVGRLTKWIFPEMSEEDIAAELEEVKQMQTQNTDEAIERILNGG